MTKSNLSRKALRDQIKNITPELVDIDKKNYDKLYFYASPSDPKWLLMGGNSALIFINLYASRLNYHGSLRKDTDSFAKFGLGTLRFGDFETKYAQRLTELGLKPIQPRHPENAQYIKIFKLPQAVSSLEINRWRNKEETAREQLNKYLEPKIKKPTALTDIRLVSTRIIDHVRRMNPAIRELYGVEAGKKAFALHMGWLAMAKEQMSEREYLEQAQRDIDWLLNWLHFLLNTHEAPMKFIANSAEELVSLQEKITKQLNKKGAK